MSEREWSDEKIAKMAWARGILKGLWANNAKPESQTIRVEDTLIEGLEKQLKLSRSRSETSDEQQGSIWSQNNLVPTAVESYREENGERFTRVTFPPPCGAPMCLSADDLLKGALDSPTILAFCMPWFFIRPWLRDEQKVIDLFWKSFSEPGKEEARRDSCHGIKWEAWKAERTLLEMIPLYRKWQSEAEEGDSDASILAQAQKNQFVEWLLNAVHHDPQALIRLNHLIKDPTSARGEKGDKYAVKGSVFRAFGVLVARNQKLPTKLEVRLEGGLGNESDGLTKASRAFKELGLSGLPEAG